MTDRFPVGSTAYTKDGRAYTVEEVDGGIVYCSLPNGTETDFPEEKLISEAEWANREDGQDDVMYGRVKHANLFMITEQGIDTIAAEKLLERADSLVPGLLDYLSWTAARQALVAAGNFSQSETLSIIKCRAVFNEMSTEARICALASLLGDSPKLLASVADHGDNLVRAMLEKRLSMYEEAFEEFCDMPRK